MAPHICWFLCTWTGSRHGPWTVLFYILVSQIHDALNKSCRYLGRVSQTHYTLHRCCYQLQTQQILPLSWQGYSNQWRAQEIQPTDFTIVLAGLLKLMTPSRDLTNRSYHCLGRVTQICDVLNISCQQILPLSWQGYSNPWRAQYILPADLAIVLAGFLKSITCSIDLVIILASCLKQKIFKSWHVCDWLAKWFIKSGYMDLSRPRFLSAFRRGLVVDCFTTTRRMPLLFCITRTAVYISPSHMIWDRGILEQINIPRAPFLLITKHSWQ